MRTRTQMRGDARREERTTSAFFRGYLRSSAFPSLHLLVESSVCAGVAKLVYARHSKCREGDLLRVRVPPPAPGGLTHEAAFCSVAPRRGHRLAFRPANVVVCEWQLGHSRRRFSRR